MLVVSVDPGDDHSSPRVLVVILTVKASFVGLINGQVKVPAIAGNFKSNQRKAAVLVPHLLRAVQIVLVQTTNLDAAEVVFEVFEAHEEGTVVFGSPVRLLFELWGPVFVVIVAPIALPFELTPRISELNQFYLIAKHVGHLNHAEAPVRVLSNQTYTFQHLLASSRGAGTGSHDELLLLSLKHSLPKIIIVVIVDGSRSSRQISENVLCQPSFNTLITTMQLGPCFLQ